MRPAPPAARRPAAVRHRRRTGGRMPRLSFAEAPRIAGFGDYFTVVVILVIALGALVFAYFLVKEVMAAPQGTANMQNISRAVQEGAAAYLNRQFKTISGFVAIVFFLLLLLPVNEGGAAVRIGRSLFFVVGASFSALVGYIGMTLATRANVRVAAAAQQSGRRIAMRIAFRTGGVCGMVTVGLGLLGASLVLLAYNENAPTVLEGFGFGGALLAMFMRVGGGIFTKAADVGADLVESYAVTLVAALILGKAAFGSPGLVFPLVVPAIGVVTAVIGIFLTE